jgi:hypothetical protein
MALIEKLNAIGDAVREKTGTTEKMTLEEIATAISGISGGGGQEIAMKAFWDAFTNNNTMTNYTNAFQNQLGANKWNNQTFKPPYKLTPTDCNYMFENFNRARLTDIATITPDIVDFSNCAEAKFTFRNATISPLIVDFSNAASIAYAFATDNGGQMKEVTIKVTEKLTSTANAFIHNLYGATFTDDSVIACSISFAQSSSLSATALQSIINALATVTTAQTLTLHKNIALTDEQKATINSKGWTLAQ